jgi:hypothetical protein
MEKLLCELFLSAWSVEKSEVEGGKICPLNYHVE